ncbi:MAG: hypothetical protein RJA99_4268 [Pseudomonadota bacterium]|jgi:hypothetical protein
MRRRTRPAVIEPPASRRALSHPYGLTGPMTEHVVRELAARITEKSQAAIASMGDRYVFHPSRILR